MASCKINGREDPSASRTVMNRGIFQATEDQQNISAFAERRESSLPLPSQESHTEDTFSLEVKISYAVNPFDTTQKKITQIIIPKEQQGLLLKNWQGKLFDEQPGVFSSKHIPKDTDEQLTDRHIACYIDLCQMKFKKVHFEYIFNFCVKKIMHPPENIHEFLIICPIHRKHCALITNIGCAAGFVNVYDSQVTCDVDIHMLQVIALMMAYNMGEREDLTINYIDVQQQVGANLCVLHAVANATAVLLGKNPQQYKWDEAKMRDHLQACFDDGDLTLFPCEKEKGND